MYNRRTGWETAVIAISLCPAANNGIHYYDIYHKSNENTDVIKTNRSAAV